MNRLYFGDTLQVMREHIADASVHLAYLPDLAKGGHTFKKATRDQGNAPDQVGLFGG